jgi:hypothetical protein
VRKRTDQRKSHMATRFVSRSGKAEDVTDSIRRERLESKLSFFHIFVYKSCLVRTCVKGLGL